jgi:hypothetical protein
MLFLKALPWFKAEHSSLTIFEMLKKLSTATKDYPTTIRENT